MEKSVAPPGPVAVTIHDGFWLFQSISTIQSLEPLSLDNPSIVTVPESTLSAFLWDVILTNIFGNLSFRVEGDGGCDVVSWLNIGPVNSDSFSWLYTGEKHTPIKKKYCGRDSKARIKNIATMQKWIKSNRYHLSSNKKILFNENCKNG